MSARRHRDRLTVEELEELSTLPVLTRRHPARFWLDGSWTPEMRRQISAAPSSSVCLSENC